MIALRPLREDEYSEWDDAHRREYARGLVEHAGLSPDDTEAKVARDGCSCCAIGIRGSGFRSRQDP